VDWSEFAGLDIADEPQALYASALVLSQGRRGEADRIEFRDPDGNVVDGT
jgi:hypothetical protein